MTSSFCVVDPHVLIFLLCFNSIILSTRLVMKICLEFWPRWFLLPLNLTEKDTDDGLQRYRESELAHGRVPMLDVIA